MFRKPNQKSVVSAAMAGAAIVVGAKVGDGLAAAMPESTNGYKKWGIGVLGLLLAASVNPTTTAGAAAQNAFLGMGGKQLYEGVNELLTQNVDPNLENTTTARMINALVGHGETSPSQLASSVDWIPSYGSSDENVFARIEEKQTVFTGV
jgi:hypothetical protein